MKKVNRPKSVTILGNLDCVSCSSLQSDPAGPVILVGDVIEIREHNKRWEFHFVGNQEILYNDYAFYPALKQYELSYKEAKFERDKGITLTKGLK